MDAIKSRLEEIARETRRNLTTERLPEYLKGYMGVSTLRMGCHLGARGTYNAIKREIGKGTLEGDNTTPRVFALRLKDGLHFVTEYNGHIIDPTITQYDPDARNFVFSPGEKYPLKVVQIRDVTDLQFWQSDN